MVLAHRVERGGAGAAGAAGAADDRIAVPSSGERTQRGREHGPRGSCCASTAGLEGSGEALQLDQGRRRDGGTPACVAADAIYAHARTGRMQGDACMLGKVVSSQHEPRRHAGRRAGRRAERRATSCRRRRKRGGTRPLEYAARRSGARSSSSSSTEVVENGGGMFVHSAVQPLLCVRTLQPGGLDCARWRGWFARASHS